MNVKILQQARRYAKGQRLKKIRKRILTVLCAIVVFITTYMLILPAITLDNEVYCGIEEHTHSDSCYETVPALPGSAEIVCGVSGLVIHTHDELCYYGGELICPLDEAVEHIHSDGCYTCESVLVCTDGDEGHGHSDECFVTEVTLVCTEPELQIHTHEDGCYALQCVAEGCAHEGECTETESLPVCTKPSFTDTSTPKNVLTKVRRPKKALRSSAKGRSTATLLPAARIPKPTLKTRRRGRDPSET